jgi:hypothetical protein
VRFAAPARPLAPEAFARRLRGRGRLSLALPSRGLLRRGRVFLNGHAYPKQPLLERLVRERSVKLPVAAEPILHDWYAAGYVRIS